MEKFEEYYDSDLYEGEIEEKVLVKDNEKIDVISILSTVSNWFITLFNSFCERASGTGLIYTDVFISPKSYMSDKKYGNVACLGKVVI